MDKKYVTTGKPAIGGAVWVGDVDATLPEDAVTAIDETDFTDLGYCSEDGLKEQGEITTEDIKEWGGQVVDSDETEKKDKYQVTLIESTNPAVLKLVHGDENVTGDLENGITVKANAKAHQLKSFIVDMLLKGAVKRVVLPCAKVTAIAEVVYKRGQAVGYQVTLTAYPNADGDTHYEYIKATATATAASGSSGGSGGESSGGSSGGSGGESSGGSGGEG